MTEKKQYDHREISRADRDGAVRDMAAVTKNFEVNIRKIVTAFLSDLDDTYELLIKSNTQEQNSYKLRLILEILENLKVIAHDLDGVFSVLNEVVKKQNNNLSDLTTYEKSIQSDINVALETILKPLLHQIEVIDDRLLEASVINSFEPDKNWYEFKTCLKSLRRTISLLKIGFEANAAEATSKIEIITSKITDGMDARAESVREINIFQKSVLDFKALHEKWLAEGGIGPEPILEDSKQAKSDLEKNKEWLEIYTFVQKKHKEWVDNGMIGQEPIVSRYKYEDVKQIEPDELFTLLKDYVDKARLEKDKFIKSLSKRIEEIKLVYSESGFVNQFHGVELLGLSDSQSHHEPVRGNLTEILDTLIKQLDSDLDELIRSDSIPSFAADDSGHLLDNHENRENLRKFFEEVKKVDDKLKESSFQVLNNALYNIMHIAKTINIIFLSNKLAPEADERYVLLMTVMASLIRDLENLEANFFRDEGGRRIDIGNDQSRFYKIARAEERLVQPE